MGDEVSGFVSGEGSEDGQNVCLYASLLLVFGFGLRVLTRLDEALSQASNTSVLYVIPPRFD